MHIYIKLDIYVLHFVGIGQDVTTGTCYSYSWCTFIISYMYICFRKKQIFVKYVSSYCYHRDNLWSSIIACWHLFFCSDDPEQD